MDNGFKIGAENEGVNNRIFTPGNSQNKRSDGLNRNIDSFYLSTNAYFSRIANLRKMHTINIIKIKSSNCLKTLQLGY